MSTIGTDNDIENMIYQRKENANKYDEEWLMWVAKVMQHRPHGNKYVDSERGIEITKLVFETERKIHIWRWSDPDVFWIDIQLYTKYGLSDNEIVFIVTHQPGFEQYKKYKAERDHYAKMLRAEEKSKKISNPDDDLTMYDAGDKAISGRDRRPDEVFTPKWVVKHMCDMLEDEAPDAFSISTTFLEPTCGEGAFVVEILRRKFDKCNTTGEYREALKSVYGMDIEADNISETIQNVITLCNQYWKTNKDDLAVINDHYIMCDSLKIMRMFAKDEKLTVVGSEMREAV